MEKPSRNIVTIGISIMILVPIFALIAYSIRGKQFALRDRLRKADAIIVLVGTRGNIQFLNGKIRTGDSTSYSTHQHRQTAPVHRTMLRRSPQPDKNRN